MSQTLELLEAPSVLTLIVDNLRMCLVGEMRKDGAIPPQLLLMFGFVDDIWNVTITGRE
jgi:hypothetical protein